MTNYQRGAKFERDVKKLIEAAGWFCQRSPQSRSKTDLIALSNGERPIFVQCKLNGRIDPDEWNELWEVCNMAGALPVLASKKQRGKIVYEVVKGVKGPGKPRRPSEVREFNELFPDKTSGPSSTPEVS